MIRPLTAAIALTGAYLSIFAGMYIFNSAWLAILGLHAFMCLSSASAGGRRSLRTVFRGLNARTIAAAGCVGVFAGPAIHLLWRHMQLQDVSMLSGLIRVGLGGRSWLVFAIYYSVVNPWVEELFWRDHLPTTLPFPWLSDFLYAGYHVLVVLRFVKWPWAIVAFAVLVCAGAFWRREAGRNNGLLVPVATHFVADVSIVVAAHLLANGG